MDILCGKENAFNWNRREEVTCSRPLQEACKPSFSEAAKLCLVSGLLCTQGLGRVMRNMLRRILRSQLAQLAQLEMCNSIRGDELDCPRVLHITSGARGNGNELIFLYLLRYRACCIQASLPQVRIPVSCVASVAKLVVNFPRRFFLDRSLLSKQTLLSFERCNLQSTTKASLAGECRK